MPDFPSTLSVPESISRPGSPLGFANGSHPHPSTGLQQGDPSQVPSLASSHPSTDKSNTSTTNFSASTALGKPSSEVRPSSLCLPEARSVVKHSSLNFIDHPSRSTPSPGIQSANNDPKQRRESDLQILRRIKIDISSGHHTSYSAIIKPLALKAVSVTAEEAEKQHLAALELSPTSLTRSLADTHHPKDSSLSASIETVAETVPPPNTDERANLSTGPSTFPATALKSTPVAPRSFTSRLPANAPSSVSTGPSSLKDRLFGAKHEYASRAPSTTTTTTTTTTKVNPQVVPPTQPRAHAESLNGRRQRRPKVDLDSSKDGPDAMMLDYSGMYDEVPAASATVSAFDDSKVAGPGPTPEAKVRSPKKDAPAAPQSPVPPAITTATKGASLVSNDASPGHLNSELTRSKTSELHSDKPSVKPATSNSPSGEPLYGGAFEQQNDQMDEEEAEIETFLTSGIEDSSVAVDSERIDLSKSAPTSTTTRPVSYTLTSSSALSIGNLDGPNINSPKPEEDERIQMSSFQPRKPVSSTSQSSAPVSTPTPTLSSTTNSWWNWRVPMMRNRAQSLKPGSEPFTSSNETGVPPTPSSSTPVPGPVADEKEATETAIKEVSNEQEQEEREQFTSNSEREKGEQQQHEKASDRSGFANRRELKQASKEKERRDREIEAKEYKEARLKPTGKGKERASGKGNDRYHPYERFNNGSTSLDKATAASRHIGGGSTGSEPPVRPFDVSPERRPEEKFPYRYDVDTNADMIQARANAYDTKTISRSNRPGKSQGTDMFRGEPSTPHHPKLPDFSSIQTPAYVPPPPHQSGPVPNSAYPSKFQTINSHPPPPPLVMDPPSTGYVRNRPSSGQVETSDWSNTARQSSAGHGNSFSHRQQPPLQPQQILPSSMHSTYPPVGPSNRNRHPPGSFGPLPNGKKMTSNTSGSGPGPNESNVELLREMQALKEKLALLEQQASGNDSQRGNVNSVPSHLPPALPHSQSRSYPYNESQYQQQQQDQHRYQHGYAPYDGPPFTASQPSQVEYPPRGFNEGLERGWTTARPIMISSSERGSGGRFLEHAVLPTYQHQNQQQQDHVWKREDEEARGRGWGR